jgi:hypothetical protein
MVSGKISSVTILCPVCDSLTLRPLEIVDREYASRNKLTDAQATDIAEDGLFEFMACTACGYKYVDNGCTASSSQIKALLLGFFIDRITAMSTVDEIVALEHELIACDIKIGPYPSPASLDVSKAALFLLKCVNDWIDTCDLDSLLDVYNEHASEDICDVSETEILLKESDPLKDPNPPLKESLVLVDD